MYVVFLARFFYPHIGGVEKHVLEISKILLKKDYKVIVLTERYDNSLKVFEQFLGIDIYRIKAGKDNFFKKFKIWFGLWKFRKLIKTASIIHAHDVFFWYLPFRFLYFNKPIFTTFHGYESYPVSRKAIIVRKISEKLSKGNICIGGFIKKWYGTEPTYTTYGGVGILPINTNTTNKYQSKNRKLKILLLGRLEKDTGISIYLRALELLRGKELEFEFEACGDGSLKREVERYGKVHGFVEDIDIYINNADIVFASSYLSILEVMKHKKLIFTVYDNPLKRDYLRMSPFAKWIVIEKSSERLALKIKYFMSYFKEREKTVNTGYNWVVKQNWQNVVNLYVKLWHSNDIYH